MAEFSFLTRLVASLLLLAVSAVVWRLLYPSTLQNPSQKPLSTATTSKKEKKKTKKKAARKANKQRENQEQNVHSSIQSTQQQSQAAVSDDDDDEFDEDDGLTAAQVLMNRRFQPTAISGGKSANSAQIESQETFRVQDQVLARFEGGTEWFPATILVVRRGREYNIKYDDGAIEYRVPHAMIKARPKIADAQASTSVETSSPSFSRSSTDEEMKKKKGNKQQLKEEAVANMNEHADVLENKAEQQVEEDNDNDDEEDEDEDDDGWQMVGKTATTNTKRKAVASTNEEAKQLPHDDGLTKRQRENRRKKERQKEIKEMARVQAQAHGLHARWGGTLSQMRYVPPPTKQE